MHSQIQCPVCTLYLHVGMNLYVHLDTHPKDQVIRALVNMTVVQNSPEDEPINQMTCSRYAPLNDDTLTADPTPTQSHSIASIDRVAPPAPPAPPAPHPSVVVVVPNQDLLSHPARSFQTPTTIAKITSQNQATLIAPRPACRQPLPPPPPYGEYSKLCAIVRSDSNHVGISTHARNHILHQEGNTATTASVVVSEPQPMDEAKEDEEMQEDEETDEYITDNHYTEYDDDSYDPTTTTTDNHFEEEYEHDYLPLPYEEYPETQGEPTIEQSQHIPSASNYKVRRIADRRRSNGLHVLSDVTLTPDLSITSIINVQRLTKQSSDTIHLSDMIPGGGSAAHADPPPTKIPVPSESNDRNETVNTKSEESAENTENPLETMCDIEALRIDGDDNDSDDDDDDTKPEDEDSDVELILPECQPEPTTDRNILIVKIESLSPTPPAAPSSAATSVIRMAASPRKTNNAAPPPEIPHETPPPPGTSESAATIFKPQPKTYGKPPFTKSPKKLVVKFKTPFVPVIEEEANMQPPDRTMELDDDTKAETPPASPPPPKLADDPSMDYSHPFSPFRQSFTPVPLPVLPNDPPPDEEDPWVNSVPQSEQISSIEIKDETVEADKSDAVLLNNEEESKDFVLVDVDIGETEPSPEEKHDIFQSDCLPETSSTSFASTSNQSSNASSSVQTAASISFSSASSASAASGSSSSSSSSTRSHTPPRPGPSSSNRSDYGLCMMLGYNAPSSDRPTSDPAEPPRSSVDCCADALFSTPSHVPEYGWTQRFSPQYVPFETDKSTYTNLDDCKTIGSSSSTTSTTTSNNNNNNNTAGSHSSFTKTGTTTANSTATSSSSSASSDSLNIRTDEQMPAKGEISEQESNGDLDGSWSLHVYPLQDTLPRYTSSYDTTVARESWSLGNGPSGSKTTEETDHRHERCATPSDSMQMMLPKFTALEATYNNDEIDQKPDIKPNILDVFLSQPPCHPIIGAAAQQPAAIAAATASSSSSSPATATQPKLRRFRCTVCPLVLFSLKTKRQHLSEVHHIDPPQPRRRKATATVTSNSLASSSSSPSTTTTNAPMLISSVSSLPSTAATTSLLPTSEPVKLEDTGTMRLPDAADHHALCIPKAEPNVEPKAAAAPPTLIRRTNRLNYYLLNYNWTVLRDRLIQKSSYETGELDEKKLPLLPTDTNTYMCMVCQATFKTVRKFDEHMSVHPSECYTCGREFRHWYNLSVHLKRHLNIREHQCKQCPKRFVSRTNLVEHMSAHTTEARLQCHICMRRFRRHSNLILHRKREHLNIRPRKKDFICWCGEVFHSKAKIAWHRETHDKAPKCCPHCRERFVHRNSLSRHIRISHTDHFVPAAGSGTTMVKCAVCAKLFLKTSLKLHMVTHDPNPETNGALEFACTICNKSFTTKWNLKQHKWVHASRSTKPFRCTVCPKAFIREADFTTHVNTHKSIKPYTCDHCGLQFARKYNWLRHTREHEKPKGFRCDDCGKIFHRAYYLKEHRRTHTGERPFECVICGKTSTTKTNHNKHIKIHHARDPMPSEA